MGVLIPTVDSYLFFQQPISEPGHVDNIRSGAVCAELDERRVVCAFDELFLCSVLFAHGVLRIEL